MRRLVYAPKVQAWVKADSGIVDLSPYLVRGGVDRKLDQVSPANLSFRNPNFMFTEHRYKNGIIKPLIHPQDPIIIAMSRLADKPIQVFTGYVDKSPYISLIPGVVSLTASCTLKRLQYSFWDPGLDFIVQFLRNYGWYPDVAHGGIHSPPSEVVPLKDVTEFNDGSIANLLYAVLRDIGGWHPSTIYIEPLPNAIGPLVIRLFHQFQESQDENEETKELFEDLLTNLIGKSGYGGGGGKSGGAGVTGTADLSKAPEALQNFPRKRFYNKNEILDLCKAAEFPDPNWAAGVSWVESGGGDSWADSDIDGDNRETYSSGNPCCHGLWQLYLGNSPLNNNIFANTKEGWENARDPLISTWNTSLYIQNGGSWNPWEAVTRGMVKSIPG